MATTSAPGVSPGQVCKYPVGQPDGSTRYQAVLVVDVDDSGAVRGFPVGYVDESAQFEPGQLS